MYNVPGETHSYPGQPDAAQRADGVVRPVEGRVEQLGPVGRATSPGAALAPPNLLAPQQWLPQVTT